jgi:hypothetical protein
MKNENLVMFCLGALTAFVINQSVAERRHKRALHHRMNALGAQVGKVRNMAKKVRDEYRANRPLTNSSGIGNFEKVV